MNWVLLQNSLLVAGATALAATALGFAAALWLNTLKGRWRRLLLGCSILELALPPFLVTNCWLDLLGQGGKWRTWLPLNIYSLGGTVWILTLLLWPITLLLVIASLRKLQPSHLESDPALTGWPVIRWILLPMARPALVLSAALTFVLAFNNFAVPAILQTKVYPAELWVSFNTTFDYRTALKLSWPLCLGPAVLLVAVRPAAIQWPRGGGMASSALIRQHLGWWWTAGAALLSSIILVFGLIVPLAQLGLSPRTWLELPDAFAAGRPAVWNSFWFAALSATLSGAAGLAWWRWRGAALLWLLFLVPGVLLGIGLIYALNRGVLIPLYQSAGVVILGLALRYAALSWTGARDAMKAVVPAATEFARLSGATRWHCLRHVHWPLIAPELGAIWFVTYLLCLWDVETLVLIIPPGCETLALRIFNLLHYGHNGQVNALCAILLGVAILPLLLRGVSQAAAGIGRRRGRAGMAAFACLLGLSACGRAPSEGAAVQSAIFSSVQIIGTRGTALGQFNKPRSLTVDAHDNLFVVDMTGRVQKFSSNGVYLTSWQMPQTEKGKPKGMCRDAAGNIVVVEPHYARVNHFTPEGKLVAQWGSYGTNTGQLCLPRAVAVNSKGGLVVCEYTLVDRVQVFSPDGKQCKLAFGRSGRGDGELNRPEGLAVDRQDRIYVADSCNHRIQIFSGSGEFLRAYGHAGSGLGQLSYPYDVQIDGAGREYVCEFGNSRIQIFDPEGKPLELLGGPGAAPGQFSNPWSIALDSAGNLYVADSQNHRVQKFICKAKR